MGGTAPYLGDLTILTELGETSRTMPPPTSTHTLASRT